MDVQELIEETLKKINDRAAREGGLLFGLEGVTTLYYFAAHAPTPPEDWLVRTLSADKGTQQAAYAKWAWAWAQEMVALKPVQDPPSADR